MKRTVLIGLIASLVFASSALADTYSQSVIIKAIVPEMQGLDVAISRVHVEGNDEKWEHASEICFDDLSYNTKYHIFLPQHWYVIDVGVNSNASNWTISYTATSIVGPNGYKLDNHINVVVFKQKEKSQTLLKKCTYGEMLSASFDRSQLLGGWLRIYYGISTGDKKVDPPNAKPITVDVPAGTYTGTIILTLTTS